MEPSELNPPSADDARFDAWLRRQAALTPLSDDGFAARVLHALPTPVDPALLAQAQRARRAEAWRRGWFCAAGAAAGLALHFLDFGREGTLAVLWHQLGTATISLADILSVSGVVVITTGSLVLAYWKQLVSLRRKMA